MNINDKSVDGVLGIRTWGGRMVGADESTELWRRPDNRLFGVLFSQDVVCFQLFYIEKGKKGLPTFIMCSSYLLISKVVFYSFEGD